MKKYLLCIICSIFLIACESPRIEFTPQEITTIVDAIKKSEVYMKKIPTVPNTSPYHKYVTYSMATDSLKVYHSIYNFNPNDSTREGWLNEQLIDTCTAFPGLSLEEFEDLKKQVLVLRNFGITRNSVLYDDNEKTFLYYYYYTPNEHKYSDWRLFLTVFEDPLTPMRDSNFLWWFNIIDRKEKLYLMIYN